MTFGLVNLFIFGKFSDFYHTSRLSSKNGEICVQKYPPISCNLSITNYLKQTFTIEMTFESGNKCSYFENEHNSAPQKDVWGTRRGVGRGPFPQNF